MLGGKKVADNSMAESIDRSMGITLTPGFFKYVQNLDEPEKKLSEDDIEVLRSILDFWNDKWDVWITTHSNALVAIENAKYFTVKGNTLVSVPFGEIYEYFDKK